MLAEAANETIRLLLSPSCVVCGAPLARPLAGPVCGACWQSVSRLTPPWCRICGDALPRAVEFPDTCPRCRHQPPPFAMARSAGVYDGALREVVRALKFGRVRALARPLGTMMREAGSTLLEDADAVVPVPLHPWRQFGRGFNQADDLAGQLGRPVLRLLRRRRQGPPQSRLSAGQRRVNVRGSFALSRGPVSLVAARAGTLARHRVLVLVDDVMTTGATLEECSRVLLEAGAQVVRALTAARAVAGRPPPPRP